MGDLLLPAVIGSSLPKVLRRDRGNRTLNLGDLPFYSSVLLLQGPVGPFFQKLGHYWRKRGSKVFKINFNGGDDWFYPSGGDEVIQYKTRMEYWPTYLAEFVIQKNIKAVFLFGDCRAIHRPARELGQPLGFDVIVFEEGYIRPNLFTMERFGVNHYSFISRLSCEQIMKSIEAQHEPAIPKKYPRAYGQMVWAGIRYWLAGILNQSSYPDYDHHRSLDFKRGWMWTKNFLQYWHYRAVEKGLRSKLLDGYAKNKMSDRMFLLPLQVHDDSQITTHSDFQNIEQVIELVLTSFAKHLKQSNRNDQLVIKHHPMDRGHISYEAFIRNLGKLLQISSNIIYIHDIRLPDLFRYLDGCVTVNSTIGLQALYHGVQTINLGRSFYDKDGLTFRGSLDEFWNSNETVNRSAVQTFRNYLLHHTQVNGCLYSDEYEPS